MRTSQELRRRVARPRTVMVALLATCATMGAAAQPAAAAAPGTAWSVSLVAQPTNLPLTNGLSTEFRDRYTMVVSNRGVVESTGPVTLTDVLPPGITIEPGAQIVGEGWSCSVAPGATEVSCVYSAPIPSLGQSTVLTLPLLVATAGTLTNHVSVAGGGAPQADASLTTEVGGPALQYRVTAFTSQMSDVSGAIDTAAGDHPYALRTIFDFPETEKNHDQVPERPLGSAKTLGIDLPPGVVGNPLALPRCPITDVFAQRCPLASRAGTILLDYSKGLFARDPAFPIYNVVPEQGYPAEFGVFLTGIGTAAFMYASVGPAPEYRVHVSAPSIPAVANLSNALVTFFGDPAAMNGNVTAPSAFFTNSSACSGQPLTTRIEAESWEEPGLKVTGGDTSPAVTGCSLLQFQPAISVTPSSTVADEPTGYNVDLEVPQSQTRGLEGRATPPLKNATVTLPQGVSLSSGAADGLAACSAESIDLASTESGHCPLASQVGTAEAVTPLLEEPLKGHVYIAQPGCGGAGQPACTNADAAHGNLFGLYLELAGSGVVIKQHGIVSANPATGQLTTTFSNAPQQPFSHLRLAFKDGPHAPLSNPQTCGQALTSTDMTPWSTPQTPDATPSWAFTVTGCEGGAGGMPFNPSFEAGTTGTAAGAYTSFTTTFGRTDRQQNLSAIQVHTPTGLLGMLSHVTLCREPQAAQGACSAASRIGTSNAAAGAGSQPFWVSGPVYLTGPYKGAPFGLSVAVPAVAGPFNLGTVVVRAAISVDPRTSALTITSDPLPQIIDGVPLRIQTVNVTVDRPQFMFNPTNCEAKRVTARIVSAQGSAADVASPFAAAGCKNLPFKPSFNVSTQGNGTFGGGAKGKGASLDVKISQARGEPAIGKVDTQLPIALPSRLTTLQQACTETQFSANPAGCPQGSFVGVASAVTPVLNVALTGPAILVSHGGAAFPDLDIVLQGEGIRIDLTGSTDIKKGITYSRFETVPDAPISSFELRLPEGPHSVLAAITNLCHLTKTVTVRSHGKRVKRTVATPLLMPTTITGQNGAVTRQTTKIKVSGCAATARARTSKRGHGSRRVK
jgi:uncharacterized repeat protein (TIGR01451 family)